METKGFDLGKKIFFLNPPENFQNIIIPMLSSSGYEIYTLSTYKFTKAVLREFPDSVIYICTDTELPMDHWYNFISSFYDDKELEKIIIGVMSTTAKKSEKEHFLLNTSIPGGFVSLDQQDVLIHDYIHSILHLNNAKGKRNFVRATCNTEKNISAQILTKAGTKTLKIENISSAGMLCSTHHSQSSVFAQSKVLQNMIIDLGLKKLKCDTLLFKSYIEGDVLFLVLLFATDLPYSVRSIIDTYVRTLLQSKIDSIIMTLPEDRKNYEKRQKSAIARDTEDAFLISEE